MENLLEMSLTIVVIGTICLIIAFFVTAIKKALH
jgi:hypothetical protein